MNLKVVKVKKYMKFVNVFVVPEGKMKPVMLEFPRPDWDEQEKSQNGASILKLSWYHGDEESSEESQEESSQDEGQEELVLESSEESQEGSESKK